MRYGERSFSSVAPKLWNALPVTIRDAKSLDVFKRSLKTHFFVKISWDKIDRPSQSLTFLGIVITCSLSLAMPVKKQREFYELLLSFQNRKRASVKQITIALWETKWSKVVELLLGV